MAESPDTSQPIDVAVIGGGPAGLSAATALKQGGVKNVVVLERETEAVGIPRHCGHPPFGMREFHRILRGPTYAAKLVMRAQKTGVDIRTRTTVIELKNDGVLTVTSPEGPQTLKAKRVIIATGVRETPRSNRLISGARVQGIMNTGALQSMVYLKNKRPCRKPVIIGSELVAFSAILTCRHAGIHPVAMVESRQNVTARWPNSLFPALAGIRLMTGTELEAIEGLDTVKQVHLRHDNGRVETLACDSVILTGQFVPESTLARCGHLDIDPGTGGPKVDQWGRCSDPNYFATGNLLRPVETAGWCWNEGRQTGQWVARDLSGQLGTAAANIPIILADTRLKYVVPQHIGKIGSATGMKYLQLRVSEPVRGILEIKNERQVVWSRRINKAPERRILIPLKDIEYENAGELQVTIRE